jgi:hypothetical protein
LQTVRNRALLTKCAILALALLRDVPNGTAQCLWTGAFCLHELGRLEVTRASNLEFNNQTQHWEVKDRRGKTRFIAKSRSACLEWEHQNLQPE